MGGRVWSEEDKARMLELYGQGWDTSSLAEMFDRTEDAVRQQTAKAHVYRTAEKLSEVRRRASGLSNVQSVRQDANLSK